MTKEYECNVEVYYNEEWFGITVEANSQEEAEELAIEAAKEQASYGDVADVIVRTCDCYEEEENEEEEINE